MSTQTYAEEIVHALRALPREKILEVRDYVLFLKNRYGKQQDTEQADWSESDMKAFRQATLNYWDHLEFAADQDVG